jgi:hypothetical protein
MAKPTYNAYSVREYEKDGKKDSFWTKIGVLELAHEAEHVIEGRAPPAVNRRPVVEALHAKIRLVVEWLPSGHAEADAKLGRQRHENAIGLHAGGGAVARSARRHMAGGPRARRRSRSGSVQGSGRIRETGRVERTRLGGKCKCLKRSP